MANLTCNTKTAFNRQADSSAENYRARTSSEIHKDLQKGLKYQIQAGDTAFELFNALRKSDKELAKFSTVALLGAAQNATCQDQKAFAVTKKMLLGDTIDTVETIRQLKAAIQAQKVKP